MSGRVGASNNFARGYHTDGLMMANSILDVARREAESCDCLQGIQMIHAIGGGTGGGLGCLLLDQMRDEYPDRVIVSHCIVPSPKVCTLYLLPSTPFGGLRVIGAVYIRVVHGSVESQFLDNWRVRSKIINLQLLLVFPCFDF